MSRSRSRSGLMSEINVTPFVDVMLVLLIIFMVAAPMMTQGVEVDLPTAEAKSLSATETEHLLVTIERNGTIYINDFAIEQANLTEKLKGILSLRQDRRVFLCADRHVDYGTVVQTMVAIQNAGVDNLGMVTIPYEEKTKQNVS